MSRTLSAPVTVAFDYTRSTGPVLGRFLTGLRDGVLVGGRGQVGGGLDGRLLAIGCASESVDEIRLGGHRESHVIGDGARLRVGPYQGVNHGPKKPIKPMT